MWSTGRYTIDPDTSPVGVGLFTDDGRLQYLNDTLMRMLQLAPPAMPAHLDELLAPAARVFHQMVLAPTLRLRGRADEVTLILRRRDGTDLHVLVTGVRRVNEGEPVNHCVFAPIDQRKKLEEQLVQVQRAAAELPGVMFQLEIGLDGDARFTHIGDGAQRLLGIAAERLRESAEPLFRAMPTEDRQRVEATMRQAEAQGSRGGHLSFRIQPPAPAKPRWCAAHGVPRRLPDGAVVWHGYMSDITQQRKVEEQLRENDKLRATALVASGVAHDFNNLLGSISGLAELSLLQADEGSRLQRNLQRIFEATQKAAVLVRQLLDYSRQRPQQLHPQELTALLQRCEPLLKVLLPPDVALRLQLADEHDPLLAPVDAVQLEQVLMNLVNNAGYAMRGRGGGEVCVALHRAPAAESPLQADSARLRVIDEGCGIAPEAQKLLFQPFYTTKPVGEGTGLGLAAVHGIIAGHHGRIEVNSQLHVGTVFTLWLPLVAADPAAPPAPA